MRKIGHIILFFSAKTFVVVLVQMLLRARKNMREFEIMISAL